MKHKFHIENINHPVGCTHNRIVEYACFDNVIRYALPHMPPGQYLIHQLNPWNIYGPPIRSMPAYKRVGGGDR